MALIGQHQQTAFANPQAGQSPMAASVVRGNDNAVASKHNAHDSDATIHVQSGLLSARPAAGTAFALYADETGRLYQDNGTDWVEVPYLRVNAASNTLTGNLTVEGNAAVEGNFAVDGTTALGATQTGDLDVVGTLSVNGGTIPQARVTNLVSDLAGKAAASHTHSASDITSGTLNAARLPTIAEATSAQQVSILTGARGFFPDPSNTALIRASDSDDYIDTTAPTGGTQRWLTISIDGVRYSILATRSAP
jgi:hypothetical protein